VLCFCFSSQRGQRDGWSWFHQIRVLQNSSVSCLGESCFGKLSVHQIRRLVQFLSPFPPCFLKGLKKKSPLFSRKVTLKFICGVFTDFICVIPRQLWVVRDNVAESVASTFKAACLEKGQDLSFSLSLYSVVVLKIPPAPQGSPPPNSLLPARPRVGSRREAAESRAETPRLAWRWAGAWS